MKQLLRVIAALMIAFAPFSSEAQISIVDTNVLHEIIQHTPFIFEGKVIEQCTYKEPLTGEIYTTNFVEVSKTFRGSVNCGVVPVVTRGGA